MYLRLVSSMLLLCVIISAILFSQHISKHDLYNLIYVLSEL
jgi:hypothetical protein